MPMDWVQSVRKVLKWRIFNRPPQLERFSQIVGWWESRRLLYNVLVGGAGILTLIAMGIVAWWVQQGTGESPNFLPDPPAAVILAPFAYGICANLCYTGGWMAEWFVRRIWKEQAGSFGQISFSMGLAFSLLLTLLPVPMVVLLALVQIINR